MSFATTLPPVLAIIAGFVVCLFGYRLMRVTLAIAGFGIGMFVGFAVVGLLNGTNQAFAWIVAVVCGILFALLATLAYKVGVFLLGAVAGVLFASILLAATGWPYPGLVRLAVGLALGLLTLFFERPLVSMLTAFAGAWGIVAGVSALLGGHTLVAQHRPPYHAVMLVVWILLGVLGAAPQLRAARRQPKEKE